jgi:hypothetical protein
VVAAKPLGVETDTDWFSILSRWSGSSCRSRAGARANFSAPRRGGLGLMTVREITRAGLVITLVISQLVKPQAFAENGVVSCSSDQRGKIIKSLIC